MVMCTQAAAAVLRHGMARNRVPLPSTAAAHPVRVVIAVVSYGWPLSWAVRASDVIAAGS